MKIAIACGGTGGHIFPGLATATVLQERGQEVKLWLSGKDIEKEALRGWTGQTITIKTSGLPARPGLKYIGALWQQGRAFLQCRRELRRDRPEVLLAFGGYGSAAPVLAAAYLSIPVILHEANVIPGRTNRFLSRWAKVFALGFEETRRHIRHPNMIYTGIPLRKMKTEKAPADWNVLKREVFTILAMGGSRGAHTLNEMTAKAVAKLHAAGQAIQIIHLTGTADESEIRKLYRASGVPHLVFAFLHDMAQAFGRAQLAICRAGASTCAELARYGVPALLVPYPHAAANHQLANARALGDVGAADVIEEKNLTAAGLADYVGGLIENRSKLENMRQAAGRRADRAGPNSAKDAAATLADLVLKTRG